MSGIKCRVDRLIRDARRIVGTTHVGSGRAYRGLTS